MKGIEDEVQERHGRPLPEPQPARFAERVFTGFSFIELFTAGYLRRTVMIWLAWFFVLLGYYGITTWMGKLLVDRGFSVVRSTEFVILMTLWGVPGFFSAAYAVEKLGRKPTVVGYVLLSAVAAFFYGRAGSQVELIVAGAFMQFFFFGMWSVLYAYTPELFPTRARATGCGTSSAAGRLGALIGPAVVPLIIQAYSTEAVFSLGAVAFVVAALAVLVFGPETKSKVLEEISA
jgi:putative MFS transporter